MAVVQPGSLISDFRVSEETIAALKERGIERFFPIQEKTFDHIYDKKDVIGRARTGTGKTLSFALPLVERLLAKNRFKPSKRGRAPIVLCLLPTRELCQQVFEEFDKLSVHRFKSMSIYGGVPFEPQTTQLRNGVDVVVGTPGRIMDLIRQNHIILNKLKAFVLDEADQMLDNDFKINVEEILGYIKDQKKHNPEDEEEVTDSSNPLQGIQMLLFSATLPEWVNSLVNEFMSKDRVKIDVVQGEKMQGATTIRHITMQVAYAQRAKTLGDVLTMYAGLHGRCIIFTETKAQANDIALNSSIKDNCQALHGDIPQAQREQTLKAFKDNKFRCLVATDVAARGLHIDNIELVVQLIPAKDIDTYVHRSGRTGRAGKSGIALTFCNIHDMPFLESIERKVGLKFERVGVPQPELLLQYTATSVVDSLKEIPKTFLNQFEKHAQDLIKEFGASEALQRCLCELSGYSDPKKSVMRSALTGREDCKTFQVVMRENREIRTTSYVWNLLKNLKMGANVDQCVSAVSLRSDRLGAVFDVHVDGIDALMEAVEGLTEDTKERYYMIEPVVELPELEDKSGSYGSKRGGQYDERAIASGRNPVLSRNFRGNNSGRDGGDQYGNKRRYEGGRNSAYERPVKYRRE